MFFVWIYIHFSSSWNCAPNKFSVLKHRRNTQETLARRFSFDCFSTKVFTGNIFNTRDFALLYKQILYYCIHVTIRILNNRILGSAPFDHGPIDHNHSQQPVPKGFPLFKRCEWLVINRTVVKWIPPIYYIMS